MNHIIDANAFRQMVLHGAAAIAQQKQLVNDLNVFPVPDGDTGTNMSLTMAAAAAEMKKNSYRSLGEVAGAVSSALLRGARGNSGVILSLLFRGIAKGLKGRKTADGITFAAAMQEGVAAAYGAVMKPAEGTVLTVSRLASKAAADAAAKQNDVQAALEAAICVGTQVLAQTTDMNPVLKKAGVVDAGGKGYLIIFEGMLAALQGKPLPEVSLDADSEPEKVSAFEQFDTDDIRFSYCTEFIVERSSQQDAAPLRRFLEGIGDSLVLVDDEEIIKVHIHTNHPGLVLEEALHYGCFLTTKVENMKKQHSEILSGISSEAAAADTADIPAKPEKRYGFLSVCAGEGIANVFRDLGVDGIISGGQTMNPSTESILTEISKVPAEVVFVLPNNKNIIMAAQQCVNLISSKQVVVVPTHTIPQGIAAMMALDDTAEPEDLAQLMLDAARRVTTGQVTYAARNSDFDGFTISEGDYLALLEGKLLGTDRQLDALLELLAVEAHRRNAEFITLFYGADVSQEDAEAAAQQFAAICPDAELTLLPGGQPVYYFIVGIE